MKAGPMRWLLAGDLPLAAVLIFCAGSFWAGQSTVKTHDKVAVVEKGAIVLEAVMSNPKASPEQMEADVKQPILTVLKKYASAGYTVIDVSKDDNGSMNVVALPADAIDITAEMRKAVHLDAATHPRPTSAAASANTSSVGEEGHRE